MYDDVPALCGEHLAVVAGDILLYGDLLLARQLSPQLLDE